LGLHSTLVGVRVGTESGTEWHRAVKIGVPRTPAEALVKWYTFGTWAVIGSEIPLLAYALSSTFQSAKQFFEKVNLGGHELLESILTCWLIQIGTANKLGSSVTVEPVIIAPLVVARKVHVELVLNFVKVTIPFGDHVWISESIKHIIDIALAHKL